jgi:hypothetical protein
VDSRENGADSRVDDGFSRKDGFDFGVVSVDSKKNRLDVTMRVKDSRLDVVFWRFDVVVSRFDDVCP